MVVTLVSFLHFAVYRRQTLTPSVAFTAVRFLLFTMLKWLIDVLYTVVAGRWYVSDTMQMGSGLILFDSLLRDGICSERTSRNFNQHASGMS